MSQEKISDANNTIEDAIYRLMSLGLTQEAAASLLVVQGLLRVESQDKRSELVEFANSLTDEDDFVSVYRKRRFIEM